MEPVIKRIQMEIEQLQAHGQDRSSQRIVELQMQVDRLKGLQTGASVDSELSMLLFGDYDLYRWQPNTFNETPPDSPFRVLMVSRLDGPTPKIATSLVDKAIAAEKKGLHGNACIDSRGIRDNSQMGQYDQSLRDLAAWLRANTGLKVIHDDGPGLFQAGACPQTAIYCGWYSLQNYVDAFEFVEGAIGFHIASFEASNLRDPSSRQWCPAMLQDGITATIGPVDEPYLAAFPLPLEFFKALFDGHCLAEAFYLTNPYNSWQMLLIGDPLYRPFASKY
jgi:uncharacterized protein (TIGR03790 family)